MFLIDDFYAIMMAKWLLLLRLFDGIFFLSTILQLGIQFLLC
ncbi:hypothetical protein PTUN_a1660 [Pseudoalteromonas tunicata]|uniref:Uncharacterized protein n=1 Tax=Pseudoalteromonas tunicata D2 TaxID=87626 RepID=A4CBG5_9GAMM|nr:hypothetical protein PTUN_a1660 [Pseudoalteromonas tunicata]EAR27702.1 hypothetical protein PTD2_17810 [Pseudoalteromonas tunicata D2]